MKDGETVLLVILSELTVFTVMLARATVNAQPFLLTEYDTGSLTLWQDFIHVCVCDSLII